MLQNIRVPHRGEIIAHCCLGTNISQGTWQQGSLLIAKWFCLFQPTQPFTNFMRYGAFDVKHGLTVECRKLTQRWTNCTCFIIFRNFTPGVFQMVFFWATKPGRIKSLIKPFKEKKLPQFSGCLHFIQCRHFHRMGTEIGYVAPIGSLSAWRLVLPCLYHWHSFPRSVLFCPDEEILGPSETSLRV